jgi:transcriptional regulator with XRE-family HTH domain
MNTLFAETLKKLRTKKGLTQNQLARAMFVNNTTISKWESGSRLPDAAMITRLARTLEVDVGTLFSTASESDESSNIIMVDDNKDILTYSLQILEEVVPNAMITAYNWPQDAIEYAKTNRVDLAILDIELGKTSGLDLCHGLEHVLLVLHSGGAVVELTLVSLDDVLPALSGQGDGEAVAADGDDAQLDGGDVVA